MFGVKEGELALMSSVLLELASWLWLAVGLSVESYVDHDPKQQNPQQLQLQQHKQQHPQQQLQH